MTGWLPPLMTIALASCLGADSSPASASGTSEPAAVTLHVGESHAAAPEVTVTFDAVVSDSRCPEDATCIWQGDAVVRLGLRERTDSATFDLHVFRQDRAVATLGGLTVRVERLRPAARSDRSITPDEYELTVAVTCSGASASVAGRQANGKAVARQPGRIGAKPVPVVGVDRGRRLEPVARRFLELR